MLNRQISVVLALSFIVLLTVVMCILIIMLMIVPNSSRGGVKLDDDSGTATHEISDKKIENREQMDYSSRETTSRILFIVGLVLASGLLVVLIVIILVVCIWSRKSQGYIVGDELVSRKSTIVAGNEGHQLTHHSYNKNKFPEERHKGKDSVRSISKKDTEKHPTLVTLPYPPLKTVAVSSQVNCTDLTDGIENTNSYCAINGSNKFEKTQVVQPQNYGSLSRSHLLSTVDEDGYHIDNFGLEFDEDTRREDSPAFIEAKSPSVNAPGSSAQAALHTFEEIPEELPGKPRSTTLSSPSTETELNNKNNPLERQLSKQDSFIGLPPFKAFDKYLTLVRLDSTTSLESCNLEETKQYWESIEEEDEDREKIHKIEEKEDKNN